MTRYQPHISKIRLVLALFHYLVTSSSPFARRVWTAIPATTHPTRMEIMLVALQTATCMALQANSACHRSQELQTRGLRGIRHALKPLENMERISSMIRTLTRDSRYNNPLETISLTPSRTFIMNLEDSVF